MPVTVAPHSLTEIALLALGFSLPVVLVGVVVIRLARSWSITVSMVALVLIPTLATFAGVFGASGFMSDDAFRTIAVILSVVAVVTLPAAVMLARYLARRTVWEQEIQDAEQAAERPQVHEQDLGEALGADRRNEKVLDDVVLPGGQPAEHHAHEQREDDVPRDKADRQGGECGQQ